jgi:hypothetical protein
MAVQEKHVVSPSQTPGAGQRVAGRQGAHFQKGIYLVPTSAADGRERWETIIRLLSRKRRDKQVDALMAMLGITEKGDGK